MEDQGLEQRKENKEKQSKEPKAAVNANVRETHHNKTEEQRAVRNAKSRERYCSLTREEKDEKNARLKKWRARQSKEKKAKINVYVREWRANQSKDKKDVANAKRREKKHNKTEEQRAIRNEKRRNQYHNKTEEQKAARSAKRSKEDRERRQRNSIQTQEYDIVTILPSVSLQDNTHHMLQNDRQRFKTSYLREHVTEFDMYRGIVESPIRLIETQNTGNIEYRNDLLGDILPEGLQQKTLLVQKQQEKELRVVQTLEKGIMQPQGALPEEPQSMLEDFNNLLETDEPQNVVEDGLGAEMERKARVNSLNFTM